MFWRLFFTYLSLVVAAVALVGAIIYQRAEQLFYDLARDVAFAVLLVILTAVGAAYLLAKWFTRPLDQLTEGARRIADGDFGHEIRVSGSGHHAALAETFNAMSNRLAGTFDQLEHDREQLHAILSGMVEGVIAIDDQRHVLFANDKAGELLGFDPAQARKNPLPDVTRHLAFIEIVEKGLAATGAHREELELKGPPQRSLTVYVSRFRGHGAPGAIIVLDDTTDVKQAEQMRQDFVANVSHELKTPLAVIKSSVEALVDGAADEPEARGMFLTQVTREADRLEALIQDLLSLARIESGHLGLEHQAIELGTAITDCVERHQPARRRRR